MSEEISEVDRRNFLKAGAGTVASVTGLTAISEAASSPSNYKTENILYGPHTKESTAYNPEKLSDDIDGLFVENSSDYLEDPVQHLENLHSRPQYRELIDGMSERDIAIYFGDVDLSTDAQVAETGLTAAEAGTGAALAAKAGLGEKFSKKDCMLTGLAGWLLQPFATYSAFMGSDEDLDYVLTSNNIHPESFAMTRGFRNDVTAYKQNNLEGDFGTVWGSLHRGFEKSLDRDSESLRNDIERIDDLWKKFVGNKQTVSRAVEMRSHEDNWYVEEVHEFPGLDDTL